MSVLSLAPLVVEVVRVALAHFAPHVDCEKCDLRKIALDALKQASAAGNGIGHPVSVGRSRKSRSRRET